MSKTNIAVTRRNEGSSARLYQVALAAAVAVAAGSSAFAEDPRAAKPAMPPAKPPVPASTVSKSGAAPAPAAPATTARDDAAKAMPAWDSFGASQDAENREETFFRLSKDFAGMQEIGVRRLGAVPVWPRGDLKAGPFRILPYVKQGVEYESNFYKVHKTGPFGHDRTANEASWTHINQVGAFADAGFMGGRMRVAAAVDAEWDVRYDNGGDAGSREEKADTFEFNGSLGASYKFESGMFVRSGVSYERRADPIDVTLTREFQRTNRRFFLTWGLDKDILFGSKAKFEIGTNVRDTISREVGLDDLDRTEAGYHVKVSYPFWKQTTRIFARGRYRQDERESSRINDGYVWGFDAGIEGNVPFAEGESRGLRGSVAVGFDSALYEDETFGTAGPALIRDENSRNTTASLNATLQYVMSRKSSIDLRLLRTNQFSFHGNYQTVNRADITFNHNLTPALSWRVATFYEYTDPSGRIAAQPVASPGDTSSDYPGVGRGGLGGGLRYRVNDWMDADIQYDYERRNHRLTGQSNHRASAGVTFYLNALKPRPSATR
ncbi:MAG: hypothetical protein HMLKMBBP_01696 [Planctomycetes bacterium]|nr:hypothetical protein [Planctomycetota bacterium]